MEEAERWGEATLQPVPRRLFRWMAANDYAVRRWLAVDVTGVPLGAALVWPPLQAQLFARASSADAAAVRADLAALPGHLDGVERLREDGVIGGGEANAADFQIASTLRSLEAFSDLATHLEDHPATRWAATVVPALPGPVPVALPAELLAAFTASYLRDTETLRYRAARRR